MYNPIGRLEATKVPVLRGSLLPIGRNCLILLVDQTKRVEPEREFGAFRRSTFILTRASLSFPLV